MTLFFVALAAFMVTLFAVVGLGAGKAKRNGGTWRAYEGKRLMIEFVHKPDPAGGEATAYMRVYTR